MNLPPSFDSTVYLLGSLHCLIGIIATTVAVSKGHNFGRWFLIGLVGGTFGLMWSIFLENKKESIN